ncbi:hypothetical protein DTO280E4_386 [Paecilomyces variotii]|nr:hypothetical protein DTO280E4_386 [Paecilomyces variotii]
MPFYNIANVRAGETIKEFSFSVERTDEENVYKIKTCLYLLPHALSHPEDGRPEYVRFTRPHGNNTELPSHVLLQTHAAIAQIYHASGMVRQYDPLGIIIIKQIRWISGYYRVLCYRSRVQQSFLGVLYLLS